MTGLALYELLFDSLDLPPRFKEKKLQDLLEKNGIKPEELTLDLLRELVADLLQSAILECDNSENSLQ